MSQDQQSGGPGRESLDNARMYAHLSDQGPTFSERQRGNQGGAAAHALVSIAASMASIADSLQKLTSDGLSVRVTP